MVISRKKITIEVDIKEEERKALAHEIKDFMIDKLGFDKKNFNILITEVEPKTLFVVKNSGLVIHHSSQI